MTNLSKERLEEILTGTEGVTPGPWSFGGTRYRMNGGEWQNIIGENSRAFVVVSIDPRTLEGLRDGQHIANCDPDTIRSMASELLRLREAVDALLNTHLAHHNHPVHVAARAARNGGGDG